MHVDKYADGGQSVELEDIADSCQHMRLHMMDQRLPYNQMGSVLFHAFQASEQVNIE